MLKAQYGSEDHPLKIGGIEIPCYILEDGTRVVTQRGAMKAIGMSISGGVSGAHRLEDFAMSDSIIAYLEADIALRIKDKIEFIVPGGGKAIGYDATILPRLCNAVCLAYEQGGLRKNQQHYYLQCKTTRDALADIGIIALIDEATGFQSVRPSDALQVKVNAYIAEETRKREKTFPNEFTNQLYRLSKIERNPIAKTHPLRFGKYTMQFVYDTLDEEISAWLRENNAMPGKENPLHHMRFTDFGRNKLLLHLMEIIGVLKTCKSIEDATNKIQELYPHSATNTHIRQQTEKEKDMPYKSISLFEDFLFEG